MNEWEKFCVGFKDFINQPLVMIIAIILLVAVLFIIIFAYSKHGCKENKKLNEKIYYLSNDLTNAIDNANKVSNAFNEYKDSKEEEIKEIKNNYELKLSSTNNKINAINDLLKVVCENSVNKTIKKAYGEFDKKELDLNTNQLIEEVEEHTKSYYDSKLENLTKEIERLKEQYGNKDSETTSE